MSHGDRGRPSRSLRCDVSPYTMIQRSAISRWFVRFHAGEGRLKRATLRLSYNAGLKAEGSGKRSGRGTVSARASGAPESTPPAMSSR